MALIITGIGDKGDLNNERIGFLVSADCNLKYFMVFGTVFNDDGFYNRSSKSYWFAPEEVKAGDRVVLSSKTGQDSFQVTGDGTKTYFKFWGLNAPVFKNAHEGIVLSEVKNWSLSEGL